MQGDVISQ